LVTSNKTLEKLNEEEDYLWWWDFIDLTVKTSFTMMCSRPPYVSREDQFAYEPQTPEYYDSDPLWVAQCHAMITANHHTTESSNVTESSLAVRLDYHLYSHSHLPNPVLWSV
jgi:methylase of polypeptide subunit release factors